MVLESPPYHRYHPTNFRKNSNRFHFEDPAFTLVQRRRSKLKEVAAMRRIILLVTMALLMVALLVGPAVPASAAAGCQKFGTSTATEAQLETGVGEQVSEAAPANDDVNRLKEVCQQ
jgi:hypothetical protein